MFKEAGQVKQSKMWFHSSKIGGVSYKEYLFLTLFEECKCSCLESTLSVPLKNSLEKLPRNVRREVASGSREGCTPLFMACKKGHVEIVEYLINVCDVDIEQRGIFKFDDSNDQYVTPLWCSAVSGRLPVTKCLIKHGADINAVSDTGSTPVRSACFMTHFDIVCYLVEHGADIQKGNHNGGTCLINSVQSVALCSYLLNHGADVNAKDVQNKTALHYAVQERQLQTTKLLLDHGADPYIKSQWNDDALQLACLKSTTEIFDYLITRVPYPPERLADAHELLGSTLLNEFNDTQAALKHWRIAMSIRNQSQPPLEKLPVMPPRPEFKYSKEFRTEEELRSLSLEMDDMWIQSLLICERILGPQHNNFVWRLMYRGAVYADDLKYQKCIDLWKRNLEIRVQKDSILFSDTCHLSQALVELYIEFKFLNCSENREVPHSRDSLKFEDLVETFRLLGDELPICKQLLKIRPVHKKHKENFDVILRCITHLIYLLVETCKTDEEKIILKTLVTKLIRTNAKSAFHDDSILHLCVSKLNTISTTDFIHRSQAIFPNLSVVKLLLDCGASVNAINHSHSTPLHVAANSYNYSAPVVEYLLENGAHFDQPNHKGETPKSLLMEKRKELRLMKYVSLKCLAATAIVRHNIYYRGNVPLTLEKFLEFHEP